MELYYEDDCFAAPWLAPSTVLLIHGNLESSVSWYGWMPMLAREFRVIRPDLRGLGRSTVPPKEYVFSVEGWAADLIWLLDVLEIESVHVVGAKFGGTIAAQLAADYPDRVRTLGLMSALIKAAGTDSPLDVSAMPNRMDAIGHAAFAAETMRQRLGSAVSEEQFRWWTKVMGSVDDSAARRLLNVEAGIDMVATLARIEAPTLVVTTDRSAVAGLASVIEWQRQLPHSELLVIPSDGYHVAALTPDECARSVICFIRAHNPE